MDTFKLFLLITLLVLLAPEKGFSDKNYCKCPQNPKNFPVRFFCTYNLLHVQSENAKYCTFNCIYKCAGQDMKARRDISCRDEGFCGIVLRQGIHRNTP